MTEEKVKLWTAIVTLVGAVADSALPHFNWSIRAKICSASSKTFVN
jgi:hypothetical protein